MKLAVGSDHAGFDLKEHIKKYFSILQIPVVDVGTSSTASVDYPDYAERVARELLEGKAERGILVCGTGIGVSIVANKFSGLRAALAWNVEIARLSRLHNDANILCLPGRFIDSNLALDIVKAWLETPFEGGRHQSRINKISAFEKHHSFPN
jgi:ribose 5-phosphate isomerase B